MGNIRLIQNIILDVEAAGVKTQVLFPFGDCHNTTKIEQFTNESGDTYYDIYLSGGSIIRGVAGSIFESYNNTIVQVDKPIQAGTTIPIKSQVENISIPLKGRNIGE